MSVQRYKYGPGVVEAVQYNGTNFEEIYEWCPYVEMSGSDVRLNFAWLGVPAVTIVKNDWIIRTSKDSYAPGRLQDFAYIPFSEVYESIATTLEPEEVSPDPNVAAHQTRIVADGGVVTDTKFLSELIGNFKAAGVYSLFDVLYIPIAVKKDVSNRVSKFYDLSPPKADEVYYDAVQNIPASQQLWEANKVNGKPWVSFDPLRTGGYLSAPIVPFTGYPFTYFLVVRAGSIDDNIKAIFGRASNADRLDMIDFHSTNKVILYVGATAFNTFTDISTTAQFTCLFNGASSTMRRKGVQVAIGDTGTISPLSNLQFSLGDYRTFWPLNGSVVFAGACCRAITTQQRDAVENLLNTKYYPSTVG